jgi:hypothetical protein
MAPWGPESIQVQFTPFHFKDTGLRDPPHPPVFCFLKNEDTRIKICSVEISFYAMFALLSNMPGAKPYQSTYTFTPEANPFASYSQAGPCCRALACSTAVKCRASSNARPHVAATASYSSMRTLPRPCAESRGFFRQPASPRSVRGQGVQGARSEVSGARSLGALKKREWARGNRKILWPAQLPIYACISYRLAAR